jgi:beta-xylosidase
VLIVGAVIGVVAAGLIHTDRRRDASSAAAVSQLSHMPGGRLPSFGESQAIEVHNPELNDIGDPYILPVAAGVAGPKPSYILYWTTDWTANVPAAVSTDLIDWRRIADALPILPRWALTVAPPPSWSAPTGVSTMTWGPTVHPVPGGWALYYSTEDAATRTECLGAAFAASPVGPFRDISVAPIVCQASLGGDIDPSVVATSPGHLALVWKNDGNSVGAAVSIWEQRLASDGKSVVGVPVRLIGADQGWEHGIVEGPAMLADSRGGWWLFYSGGTWQSATYDTGVAWCTTPAGPCRKPMRSPLLSSMPTAVSPGGLDTFVDHRGTLWASFSAFPTQPLDPEQALASPRVLELAPVTAH